MKRITTNITLEQLAFPISSTNISTPITRLASVVTVDKNNCLTKHLGFVLDKSQKLSCTPISNKFSGFLTSFTFPFHSSSFQFFKGNSITIFINNLFANAVVSISDEPSLSSCQFLQMSFGRPSACSLKATFQILISSLDLSKFFTIKKSIIRSNSRIINSSINTNNLFNFSNFRSNNFYNYVNKYSSFFSSDSCRFGCFEIVLQEVSRNLDSVLLSSINCAKTYNLGICEKPKRVMIKPDRTRLLFNSG